MRGDLLAAVPAVPACAEYRISMPHSDPIQLEGQESEYVDRTMKAYLWDNILDPQVVAAVPQGRHQRRYRRPGLAPGPDQRVHTRHLDAERRALPLQGAGDQWQRLPGTQARVSGAIWPVTPRTARPRQPMVAEPGRGDRRPADRCVGLEQRSDPGRRAVDRHPWRCLQRCGPGHGGRRASANPFVLKLQLA